MNRNGSTDIEEPIARLQAVNQSAVDSKAYTSALGAQAMMDITQSMSPRVLGLGMRAALLAAQRTDLAVPIQTIVSNVPGPQFPLYMTGARLHSILGMGPVLDNMGLFHAVVSCAGTISINVTACREMLPDPDFYLQCLREAFDELHGAALSPPKRKAKTSRRAAR